MRGLSEASRPLERAEDTFLGQHEPRHARKLPAVKRREHEAKTQRGGGDEKVVSADHLSTAREFRPDFRPRSVERSRESVPWGNQRRQFSSRLEQVRFKGFRFLDPEPWTGVGSHLCGNLLAGFIAGATGTTRATGLPFLRSVVASWR